MGILEQKNCVRNSISKIPEYVRNFKNEYLFFLFERMHFDFEEDEEFDEGHPDDYPGYRDFYELFCKFYDKINFDSD